MLTPCLYRCFYIVGFSGGKEERRSRRFGLLVLFVLTSKWAQHGVELCDWKKTLSYGVVVVARCY
jgi:hypothetical protein